MRCSDIISMEDVSDFLRRSVIDKEDVKNASDFFMAVKTASDKASCFSDQSDMVFILYNEYASIKRMSSGFSSIVSLADAKTILGSPYMRMRNLFVRDYIREITNDMYGSEANMNVQFAAIDASLTDAEKEFMKAHLFYDSGFGADSARNYYSKYFIRANGAHAKVETEMRAPTVAELILLPPADSSAGDKRDGIAIASSLLNSKTSDSSTLLGILRKIRSGTIN